MCVASSGLFFCKVNLSRRFALQNLQNRSPHSTKQIRAQHLLCVRREAWARLHGGDRWGLKRMQAVQLWGQFWKETPDQLHSFQAL